MSHSPFINGEIATLHQAELRREAAERRLAKEVRRGRDERRLLRLLRNSFRPVRNPQPSSRVVVPRTPEGGRA